MQLSLQHAKQKYKINYHKSLSNLLNEQHLEIKIMLLKEQILINV